MTKHKFEVTVFSEECTTILKISRMKIKQNNNTSWKIAFSLSESALPRLTASCI